MTELFYLHVIYIELNWTKSQNILFSKIFGSHFLSRIFNRKIMQIELLSRFLDWWLLLTLSFNYNCHLYLISDRYYWQNYDPIHFSEGLFALGNLVTFARLCFYLPAIQQLGPLQITLGKMINVSCSPVFFMFCLFWRILVTKINKNCCCF